MIEYFQMNHAVRFSSLILAILFLTLTACGGSSGGGGNTAAPKTQTINDAKLVPACFNSNGNNPLLTTGSYFSNSNWNDPSILKIANTYIMYASADINFSQDIKIYRLTSSDGKNWSLNPSSAVFTKSAGVADWDRKSVETPSVVFFKNKYHLFYTAYPTSLNIVTDYKIGHATSNDGISWIRDATYLLAPTDPTGAVNLDFNKFAVAEPGAVVFNNKIYVYFTAIGADVGVGTTLQTIGVITSSDGSTWSSPVQVLKPEQTLYPRASYKGYSTPDAVVINNKVHLFFDVAEDPFKQVKIHHAVSTDGITNFTQDNQAIFDRSMFTFTKDEVQSPSPLLDGTNLKLYFSGHTGLDLSIGLSNCDLSN